MDELTIQAIKEGLRCKAVTDVVHLPGGVLHQHYLYETDEEKYFVKVGPPEWLSNFEAEAKSLQSIDNTATLRVPQPKFFGTADHNSYLVLEYIRLYNHTQETQQILGKQLAKMHRTKTSHAFGFDCKTTIGINKQINHWTNDWVDFYREFRLKYQVDLAKKKNEDEEIFKLGSSLYEIFPRFFKNLKVLPSLLHGDLWYGNTGIDERGAPIVYDPAAYYGHHEAELGIMKIFGGFTSDFFDAYHADVPKQDGYEEREKCYQLYHYLNHYNTFGESYRADCLEILNDLLS